LLDKNIKNIYFLVYYPYNKQYILMLKYFIIDLTFRKNLRNRYITQYSISKYIETLMLKARRIL